MLEIFGDPSSGLHQLIFDAALFKLTARQGLCESLQETSRKHLFKSCLCFFLPVYKIEDVDPINLEPQSSLKLRKHKVT